MKIIIDCQVLVRGKTGVGRYLHNLLCSLENSGIESQVVLYSSKNLKILKSKSFKNKVIAHFNFIPQKLLSLFWLQLIFPKVISQEEMAIIIFPNNVMPLLNIKRHKKVVIVHDLFNKISNNYHDKFFYFYYNFMIKRSLLKSDIIVANSKNTKAHIIKFYNIYEKKIKVVYPCLESKFKTLPKKKEIKDYLAEKYGIYEDFILYVGKIEYRKNITGILRISEILKQRGHILKTVLIGRIGHQGDKILKEMKELGENYVYLEYVNDEDLIKFYNAATVFLFPSLFEGFGYPPLEAMSCGCPVIVSNSSSLPEVVGNKGLMFNHDDYVGMAEQVDKIKNDNTYRQELVEAGLIQSKKFFSGNSSEQFLSAIKLISK